MSDEKSDFEKQVVADLEERIRTVLLNAAPETPVAIEVYNLVAVRRGILNPDAVTTRLGTTQGDLS